MSFPPGGEDLGDFYDHIATHTPVGGGAPTVVAGNYYPTYTEPLGLMEAQSNVYRCALSAVAVWAQNDTLLIDGVTWRVATVKRNNPTQTEVLLMLKV